MFFLSCRPDMHQDRAPSGLPGEVLRLLPLTCSGRDLFLGRVSGSRRLQHASPGKPVLPAAGHPGSQSPSFRLGSVLTVGGRCDLRPDLLAAILQGPEKCRTPGERRVEPPVPFPPLIPRRNVEPPLRPPTDYPACLRFPYFKP